MKNDEVEVVRKKKYWDKRIVLLTEIFLTIFFLLFFLFGVYIDNSIIEGIASNCFTAFIVTVLFTIVDWKTETDTERALDSVEQQTEQRINEMMQMTDTISKKMTEHLCELDETINSFSTVVDLYNGKSCTFCKNCIKSVKLNRDDCDLNEFFNCATRSIFILATNLESFTDFLPIISKKANDGIDVRVATVHPNYARSFNISNVVGRDGAKDRWQDMKKSLEKFLTYPEIKVKTYTTITPTIILMIVDDQCYVSYLLHKHKSRETPHFLFSDNDFISPSPFMSFAQHFEGIWNDPGTINVTQKEIYNLKYYSVRYHFVGWQYASSIFSEKITLCDLYDIFIKTWSKDTCTQRLRVQWSSDLPSTGQCTITAFLVQDFFGGEVYGIEMDDGHYHSYNVIDDLVFDLTSEQFTTQSFHYSKQNKQSREQHFSIDDKKIRYEELKRKVEEALMERNNPLERQQCII